jgi:hypothetical protein
MAFGLTLKGFAKRAAVGAVGVLAAGWVALPEGHAASLTEGSVLPNYAIVSVGPNASIMVNSGPVNGAVLLGDGSSSSSSGGGNGAINGGVFVSGTESGDDLTHINTPPTVTTVPGTIGTTAYSDAGTLSGNASALLATETFTGTVSGAVSITGDGGLNVIDFNSLNNPLLTITGTASDTFVFNVSGTFSTNEVMTLDGVSASQILWNFTGTSGNVFQTSGGDVVYGTFLATDGGNFQFSNLDLTGQLINTDGHIQDVSGSEIPTFVPFSPPATPVPEPASMILFGTALAGMVPLRRLVRRRG